MAGRGRASRLEEVIVHMNGESLDVATEGHRMSG
jgi:hypothetical protein